MTGRRNGFVGKLGGEGRRDGGVRMEIGEKIQLAGFEVLEQAEGRVSRSKAAAGENSGSLRDQKVANGCILNRTGKPKMRNTVKARLSLQRSVISELRETSVARESRPDEVTL